MTTQSIANAIETMTAAGFDVSRWGTIRVVPSVGADGRLAAPPSEASLVQDSKRVATRLGETRACFRGSVQPPSLSGEPPADYEPVFYFIEANLAALARASSHKIYDGEWEYALAETERRPDGRNGAPLLEWTRVVGRLLVTVRETSAAEFNAVFGRLKRSARTFKTSDTSTNYVEHALSRVL